jgi:DNA-binding transcriptional MerR regulator
MPFIPKKLYYKIREVCEIVGVEAHVLRYWETEFPALSPPKSKSGQRTYRPKDIELLLQIRKLLYEDGFTIAGARKRLSGHKAASDGDGLEKDHPLPTVAAEPSKANPKADADSKPASDRLKKVQSELENILTLLDRG